MTKDTLQEDLKKAMFAKDAERVSTLRMLISAIGYFEIQKGGAGYTATPEDVMQVITSEVKKRKDAIEQFMTAGREDLVAKESKEAAILEVYLPEQMSEEEIKRAVAEAIEKTGATSPSDMGKVMGVLMPVVKGKADGSLVSRLVKESLSS